MYSFYNFTINIIEHIFTMKDNFLFLTQGSQSSNEENTKTRESRSMGEDRDWSWEMNAVDTSKIRYSFKEDDTFLLSIFLQVFF